jgi:acyl-CoA thioester hydrolase
LTLPPQDQPDQIYAEGGSTTVWVNFKAQPSIPLPDWLRTLIA